MAAISLVLCMNLFADIQHWLQDWLQTLCAVSNCLQRQSNVQAFWLESFVTDMLILYSRHLCKYQSIDTAGNQCQD